MPCSRASANRIFGVALLASLVLHALLLGIDFPKAVFSRPVELLAPIVARLIEPAPPPSPPAEADKTELKPGPRPAPEAKPRPAPAPRVVAPERAVGAAPPLPAPTPAPAPAPSPVPPVAAAKPQPAPAAPDPTPSLIAQYRAALLAEAGRHKRYPPVALDNGWEGEVVVRMAIAADGSLAALEVRSSSGHAALDRQALEMFRKARASVSLPGALHGKPFSMELRAVFNLRDQASG
ncbi:MAG: energy transducer TonB [Betaproteobacteria bacterium]